MTSALISFLHFAAAFGIAAALVAEWVTLTPAPSHRQARLLQQCDLVYGVCAAVVLVAGFLRVHFFEKGSAYYYANAFFDAKLGLFAVVGLLSIYPTLRFLRWRAQMRQGQGPVVPPAEYRRLRAIVGAELILLLAIVLCAALMAHGVGQ